MKTRMIDISEHQLAQTDEAGDICVIHNYYAKVVRPVIEIKTGFISEERWRILLSALYSFRQKGYKFCAILNVPFAIAGQVEKDMEEWSLRDCILLSDHINQLSISQVDETIILEEKIMGILLQKKQRIISFETNEIVNELRDLFEV